MYNCIVCQEPGEIEFSCTVKTNLISASLCLKCFELANNDTEIAYVIIRKRQKQLATGIVNCQTVEQRERFILTGIVCGAE